MTSGSLKPREAITLYQTIESWGWLSYIGVGLKTGRTHQIRTHLKESGHPVFGDPEYGGRVTRLTGIEQSIVRWRVCCWKRRPVSSYTPLAWSLLIQQPVSGSNFGSIYRKILDRFWSLSV